MKQNWELTEVLHHSRHDWLNRMQIIKGNLSLHKYEHVEDIISNIVSEMQHESKLYNLKVPKLAVLLMTYNWTTPPIILEYEVIGDVYSLTDYDEELYTWCAAFIQCLQQQVEPGSDSHLSLSIELSKDSIRFFFDFSGIIKNSSDIINWIKSQSNVGRIAVIENAVLDNELTVALEIQ
ncbi:sporulation protein [Bacillus sp. HMF5848]|uniref:sporulation initiation phosphotransferase B n=1 Tax=Bacillus sp. HMF5848 TaxID=2495421 RepID=UPI000F78C86C|nr:sporulation initiation phosphotransferase B [Bacillus sp. HMF5848]RSK28005.1 sporulation protein [Bacillus sp. HMF5848]